MNPTVTDMTILMTLRLLVRVTPLGTWRRELTWRGRPRRAGADTCARVVLRPGWRRELRGLRRLKCVSALQTAASSDASCDLRDVMKWTSGASMLRPASVPPALSQTTTLLTLNCRGILSILFQWIKSELIDWLIGS